MSPKHPVRFPLRKKLCPNSLRPGPCSNNPLPGSPRSLFGTDHMRTPHIGLQPEPPHRPSGPCHRPTGPLRHRGNSILPPPLTKRSQPRMALPSQVRNAALAGRERVAVQPPSRKRFLSKGGPPFSGIFRRRYHCPKSCHCPKRKESSLPGNQANRGQPASRGKRTSRRSANRSSSPVFHRSKTGQPLLRLRRSSYID